MCGFLFECTYTVKWRSELIAVKFWKYCHSESNCQTFQVWFFLVSNKFQLLTHAKFIAWTTNIIWLILLTWVNLRGEKKFKVFPLLHSESPSQEAKILRVLYIILVCKEAKLLPHTFENKTKRYQCKKEKLIPNLVYSNPSTILQREYISSSWSAPQ